MLIEGELRKAKEARATRLHQTIFPATPLHALKQRQEVFSTNDLGLRVSYETILQVHFSSSSQCALLASNTGNGTAESGKQWPWTRLHINGISFRPGLSLRHTKTARCVVVPHRNRALSMARNGA